MEEKDQEVSEEEDQEVSEEKEKKPVKKKKIKLFDMQTATFIVLVAGFLFLSKGGYLDKENPIFDTLRVKATVMDVKCTEENKYSVDLRYYLNDIEHHATIITSNDIFDVGEKISINVDAAFPSKVVNIND